MLSAGREVIVCSPFRAVVACPFATMASNRSTSALSRLHLDGPKPRDRAWRDGSGCISGRTSRNGRSSTLRVDGQEKPIMATVTIVTVANAFPGMDR